jgi:succinate dehydrogenase/fumarate reductase flavoprotein subunit
MGLAINAGCKLQNLTESQFGIASTQFRWNLSGSYQQVIPKYYSVNDKGKEIEFLREYFPSFKELSKAIFLKGYQWPFNSNRIEELGSSLIDLAVYYETEVLDRVVFLDFTNNPTGYDEEELDPSAKQYLTNSDAMAETPIKRLERLNPEAIDLYIDHGINLLEDPLQIAVCNQHLNGGIQGDIWWETNIEHLFAIGEANGTHGVHRPGGSALNSGQVGGLRAAQKIVHGYETNSFPDKTQVSDILKSTINSLKNEFEIVLSNYDALKAPNQILEEIRERMAKYGSIIRPREGLSKALEQVKTKGETLSSKIGIKTNRDIVRYLRVRDALKTQECILHAILNYHNANGKSRGSYLIIRDALKPSLNEHYIVPPNKLEYFKFLISDIDLKDQVQTVKEENEKLEVKWEDIRPIPNEFGWFETVWKKYQNKNFFE